MSLTIRLSLKFLIFVVIFLFHQTSTQESRSVMDDNRAYGTVTTSETTTSYVNVSGSSARVNIDSLTSILKNYSNNSNLIAENLLPYAHLLNDVSMPSSNSLLSANEIDQLVVNLNNIDIVNSTNKSLLIAVVPGMGFYSPVTVGGVFYRKAEGRAITNANSAMYLNSNISVAATFLTTDLGYVNSLNILIIDKAPFYEYLDQSNHQRVASSIIIVGLQRWSPTNSSTNITLYFQVLQEYSSSLIGGSYSCSWYDFQSYRWSSTNCSEPVFNYIFDRYECLCTHLSTFALIWSPQTCSNPNLTEALNGTCVPKPIAQSDAVSTLRNTTNSTVIGEALSVYISSISNTNVTAGDNNTLTLGQIDNYLSSITNVNISINTSDSILIAQKPNPDIAKRVIGVSFQQNIGAQLITQSNEMPALQSRFSSAAIIRNVSWNMISSLNMLIIGNPTAYANIDRSANKTLVSSIVIATLTGTNVDPNRMTILLYFSLLTDSKTNDSGDFGCYFVDTTHNKWNSSGCTRAIYNPSWKRYECTCNHLTSFALLWLPKSSSVEPKKPTLDAQDIASLVFQSISIACFLAVLIHALVSRWIDPLLEFSTYDVLPMLSTLSTTILFIFYIALGMTVYTRTKDTSQTKCFDDATVLMFFVYFLLIFMFGIKTSVAYFNYLRFVVLFPEPSLRRLSITLIISFAIAIIWVSFAAGFNSNPAFHVSQLHHGKICWFTRDVVYYFLTIPVCIFLLLNLISFVLVTRRIIKYVHQANSMDLVYERMKRCVIVLLSSSVTQGLGWLLGPVLSVVNPDAGQVLGWFFVILNGLEGVWSILLYIIIRRNRMHEPQRVKYIKDRKEVDKSQPIRKDKEEDAEEVTKEFDLDLMKPYTHLTQEKVHAEQPTLFNDLREDYTISLPADVVVYGSDF